MSKRPGIKLKVASPCSASWDEMTGDDAMRHCGSCDKDVFQISNMSTEQVETFLLARRGLGTCVRFYQRADGTLLTSDCSVGKKAKRKKRLVTVASAAALGASALGLGYGLSPNAPQSNAKPASKLQAADPKVDAPTPEIQPEQLLEVKGQMQTEPEVHPRMGTVSYQPQDPDLIETLGEMVDEP